MSRKLDTTSAAGVDRTGPEDDDVLAAAARWHGRLEDDDVPPAVHAEFDAWLAADTCHRDAYRSIDRMWAVMADAQADPRVLDLRRDALNAIPERRSRLVAVAAVVLLVCGGTFLAFREIGGSLPEVSTLFAASNRVEGGAFRTAVGERSTVTMSDGSMIVLNTNSRVDIQFSPQTRQVRLLEGQAWFQVAKDPARPFTVEAGGQRVTAHGTAFDVRLADNLERVQVTLLEGRVTVEQIPQGLSSWVKPAHKATELAPGESLIAAGDEPFAKSTVDVSKISGWRRGQIVFDNDTLRDAVAELNRYSRTQIVLADSALGALRVSGVFTAGHSESFLETVVGHYPIRVVERPAGRVVLGGNDR